MIPLNRTMPSESSQTVNRGDEHFPSGPVNRGCFPIKHYSARTFLQRFSRNFQLIVAARSHSALPPNYGTRVLIVAFVSGINSACM